MRVMNDLSIVKQQYAAANNLCIRISIHDKYSTNKMGFGNWIVSNYKINAGMNILELGCGTGSMWKNRETLMESCSKLVLSEGMIAAAKETVGEHDNVEYQVIDIQNIPYADETFDAVIANMMLYHVPDMDKGLAEVRRVLKKGGSFYCATYGEHGITDYLAEILAPYGIEKNLNKAFTLQNGYEILRRFFFKVEKSEYEDSLAVTNIDDMIAYMYSLPSMTMLRSVPKQNIKEILIQHSENGTLKVPKEYGMFIAS